MATGKTTVGLATVAAEAYEVVEEDAHEDTGNGP
jgi:hypothetical protein